MTDDGNGPGDPPVTQTQGRADEPAGEQPAGQGAGDAGGARMNEAEAKSPAPAKTARKRKKDRSFWKELPVAQSVLPATRISWRPRRPI